jgi:four helix bundle protein
MDLTLGVERLAATLPQGHADLKDQVRRAASAAVRNIAEGANRWTPREMIARFQIARGECGECDAALEVIARLRLGRVRQIRELRDLADRTSAMLTDLIRRQRRRLAERRGGSSSGYVPVCCTRQSCASQHARPHSMPLHRLQRNTSIISPR